jgi:hypothetical protein
MNCADYTESYWRVGRDNMQQSFIERQNIAEVTTLKPLMDHRRRFIIPGRVKFNA